MKASYTQRIGDVETTVSLEFDEITDDVCDFAGFIGFPMIVINQAVDLKIPTTAEDNTKPATSMNTNGTKDD